jgi:hypothetical protein
LAKLSPFPLSNSFANKNAFTPLNEKSVAAETLKLAAFLFTSQITNREKFSLAVCM